MIFLDTDKDASHPAMKLSLPTPGETLEQTRARRAEEREKREHAITIARLDAILQRQLSQLHPPQKKNKREALEEDFADFHTEFFGVDEIARRELDRAEQVYRDDPEKLERERLAITKWQTDHIE